MLNSLSIRSYSHQRKGHAHDYHQLVLPLRGAINIEVETFKGKVVPGECVIVKSGEMHYFNAESEAKFVVADLDTLPDSLGYSDTVVFSVSPPLFHFLGFVEAQLKHQLNNQVERLMFDTFYSVLAEQRLIRKRDPRVREVMDYIENHLAEPLSVPGLASVACLSPTQFKKVFKQQTEYTVSDYITKLRMERAQALLIHTDYPMQIVAESVGYSDLSAFSRRFSKFYGMPPSKISR
ncbi:AraC family transcriptional regulator [Vibrio hannami]|uniref:helix-turn-helix domain-containing protein n=1 Tax=Vibrio hannami TaxID=2717094 RepID=UPI00240FACE6|nr:AraC family transcriptional regulator [Vibrio hannami]MDG3084876.1 AraC family transcriptional regulator [Vibrio hannami]